MVTRLIKKPILLIPAVMIAALGLVSVLALSALKPISERNGFTRNFFTGKIKLSGTVHRPEDVIDIAGATNHHIYFKTKNPAKLFITDIELQNSGYLQLDIPLSRAIVSRYNCIVDSPYVYVAAGNAKTIIKAKPGEKSTLYNIPEGVFTRAALISDNSIALRMFDKTDQIFTKKIFQDVNLVREENISEKNNDAGISTDGSLVYDKKTNLLIYTHYYKNQILCLDTNMKLISKIKIIGKYNTSSITTEKVSSRGMITNSAPKRLLNASSCVSNGYLFNNSRLKSDNESNSKFNTNSAIDVYDVTKGLFVGSFYIPSYENERMVRFAVLNNTVIAIYKSNIISYELPFDIKSIK